MVYFILCGTDAKLHKFNVSSPENTKANWAQDIEFLESEWHLKGPRKEKSNSICYENSDYDAI